MTTVRFREAVEQHSLEGMLAALADDAVLHSPITFQPFEGKRAIAGLFSVLLQVFEDFHYTDQLQSPDGTIGLIFRAHIGDRDVEGIDILRFNDAGLIQDFTVMIRPKSGMDALLAAVSTKLPPKKKTG